MLHLKCNVHRWKSNTMMRVDENFRTLGSTEMVLPWSKFHLLEDGQHFTMKSQMKFEEEFSKELKRKLNGYTPRSVLIVGDSTIGYHDWNGEFWHGSASRRLQRSVEDVFSKQGKVFCHVDAVCGSGFVAGCEMNEHFYVRLASHMGRRGSRDWDILVFVGGWNDEGCDLGRLRVAMEGCWRLRPYQSW